jgi:hypothetical protein
MAVILRDFLYSVRTLRRSPVFLAIAVLSLGLGIGANTAIFTLVNQLILQPLPVRDPAQLVMLAGRGKHYGGNNGPDRISYPMYQEIRDKNQVFSGMFCTYPTTVSASFQGGTELIGADFVSGNYFPFSVSAPRRAACSPLPTICCRAGIRWRCSATAIGARVSARTGASWESRSWSMAGR